MATIPCECATGELHVKKGRHRRFQEARSLKRAVEPTSTSCPECGAVPDEEHASWCLADNWDEDGQGIAALDGEEEEQDPTPS